MARENMRFVAYASDDELEIREELSGARSTEDAIRLVKARYGPFAECVLLEADGRPRRTVWYRYEEIERPADRSG